MASITKRGKSYLIQVSMPDGQGGYIRKSSTYTPPLGSTPTQAKRGADAYAIEFEQKCKGLTAYDENMTLDELQAWYMSDIAPNRLKEQTADVNTRFYSYYIQPLLGRYKLKQLTPVVLDNAFKQIQASGALGNITPSRTLTLYRTRCTPLTAHIAKWRLPVLSV